MSDHDFMPIDGWDHLEIWVGNAKQAAYFYENAFGFTRTAYAGPETGVRDRASYVLEQGDIRLVLTSGIRGDSEICRWAATQGDSVRDVALTVPDATNAYRQAVQRGARGIAEPHWVEDEHGRVELAAIGTYGDNVHTFVNRSEYADFHGGPGVQHVAMQTEDIVKTVAALREHGVLFITTPDTYYDDVEERVGEIEQDWADLRSMGILADRDEDGYLLQLFTKIVQDRPTLFFEVIERHGSRGFGLGNFKALFEAIEREQALRGNL